MKESSKVCQANIHKKVNGGQNIILKAEFGETIFLWTGSRFAGHCTGTQWGPTAARGRLRLRMAGHAAQHKIVNFLKTL